MGLGEALYPFIKCLVLPPGLLVLVGLTGLAVYRRWRRLGLTLLLLAPLATWVLSMPLFAAITARPFETAPPLDAATLAARHAEAILVLGGGIYGHAPEYANRANLRPLTLERLRYGAHLQRLTQLPLAVSGGRSRFIPATEAEVMKRALEEDFGVPVAAIEGGSRNTAENARMSRAALPYQTIVLVTHAMHMQRAQAQFERAGFTVIPAPVGFVSDHELGYVPADFAPTLQGLADSWYVIYEAAGALWYRYAYD
jgi:uncharacterized SAM-binding protein YcdF (DUF218 family)